MRTCTLPCLAIFSLATLGMPTIAVAADDAAISIDPTAKIAELPAFFNGDNFCALWNPTGASPDACAAVARMGLGGLRFPGGVPCEWYDWENPTASGFTTITPDDAWRMAKGSGAQMIFQTDVATTKDGTNKKTNTPYHFDCSPEHQVGWLKAAKAAGIKVAVWEIGNEPEMDAPKDSKGSDEKVYDWYNAAYGKQVEALRAADPKVRVAGPASANTWFWWHQDNLGKFLTAHGNKTGDGLADIVSLHWYVEGSEKWEDRRGAAQGWEKANDFIRKDIADHDSRNLPLMISEWNWGAGDKTLLAEQMASALGNADVIGMFRRTGVYAEQHFCLQRIKKGWGVLALGGDDSRPVSRPSPTFFALALAAKMGQTVLAVTNPGDEKNTLSAYAAMNDKGQVQVMMINKTDSDHTVPVEIGGKNPGAGVLWTLSGAQGGLTDETVTLNGVEDPDPTKADLPVGKAIAAGMAVTVPKYSLVLIEYTKRYGK